MKNNPRLKKNEYVWIHMTNTNNNETYEVAKILSMDRNRVKVKLMDYNTTQTISKNAISSNSVKYMKQMLDMNNVSKEKNNVIQTLLKNLENIKKMLSEGIRPLPLSHVPPPPPPPPRSAPPPPPPSSQKCTSATTTIAASTYATSSASANNPRTCRESCKHCSTKSKK